MNSRVLISIISHSVGATWRAAIRDTWLRNRSVEYRFVLGCDAIMSGRDDELIVSARDCYEGILDKVRCVCAWADQQGYDFVFNCFTDTYVHVPRLLASGFEAHSYCGHFTQQLPEPQSVPLIPDEQQRFDYASGGAGYWLSRAALKVIATTDPPDDLHYDDLWVGTVLGRNGIAGFHDPRYGFKGTHLYSQEQITVHLSQGTGNYDPEWMRRAHEASQ